MENESVCDGDSCLFVDLSATYSTINHPNPRDKFHNMMNGNHLLVLLKIFFFNQE